MSQGFARGLVFGGVVAVLGLGVVSQVAPPPAALRPLPPEPSSAANSPDPVIPDQVASGPAAEPVVPEGIASEPAAPEPTVSEPAVPEPVAPEPVVPEPSAPEAVVSEPVAPPSSATAGEEGATPVPPAPVPSEAGVEPDAAAALPPPAAEPSLPEAGSTPAEPPQAEAAPEAPAVTASDAASGIAPDAARLAEAPAAPVAPDPGPAPTAPQAQSSPELASVALPDAPAAPGVEMPPAAVDLPPPPPLTPEEEALLQPPAEAEGAPPAEIVPEDPAAEAPEVPLETAPPGNSAIAAAAPDASRPAPGLTPTPALPSTETHLPRIGDAPAAETLPGAGLPGEGLPAVLSDEAPPLLRYARPFTGGEGKPLFVILLVDTGGPTLDRERLAALDFPVTFVIDPQAPDAATAEAIYRAAGQEVAMLATGIPAGASAADLEQTFQANATHLPQAVAVADLATQGFQDNRPLATQVVPVIKGQGRGLVTYDRGLNAADQVARRDDLPAARIFRRLDGEGEAVPVIRRYLDRAAFKAAQEGQVVVIGDTKPDTIAALLEWAVEGRAAQVALAPLTAVLSTE